MPGTHRKALLLVTAAISLGSLAAAGRPQTRVIVPRPDIGEDTLAARGEAQIAAAAGYGVEHDFRFTDRQPESGIAFRHRVVSDAGKTYKAAHYDHGNGLAVADVDGDELLDLYFVNQVGGNELWRNLGGSRFENVTATAGVALADRIGVGASFGDIDNDGDPDLFATSVRGGNALFENTGGGNFREITETAGVGYVGHSSGAVFLDHDGDGLLDLFVTNVGVYTTDEIHDDGSYIAYEDAFSGHLMPERSERSILYHNLGENRFRDVSAEVGLLDTSWSGDASIVDFNGDGFPDLYVTSMQGDDHYYENRDGRAFAARTAAVFPRTPWGAMGICSFDFDNDGRFDLLLTDMHSDMSAEVGPEREHLKPQIDNAERFFRDSSNNILGNAFWHNRGESGFEERSDALGLENYWPWGTSVGDVNADGWQDVLLVSSMNYPFRYGINSLLLNERGEGFVPAEFVLGVEPRRGGRVRVPWFDLDCDAADRDHQRCEGRSGPVTVMATLGSRTAAIVDLDADGDLDIVTGDFNSEPQVLISDLAQRQTVNWLAVRLRGTFSNADGLGARVTVHAGDQTLSRFHDGKSGYLSQSSTPLYFGLGDAVTVDHIEVAWPSGGVQVIAGPLAAGQLLVVEEE